MIIRNSFLTLPLLLLSFLAVAMDTKQPISATQSASASLPQSFDGLSAMVQRTSIAKDWVNNERALMKMQAMRPDSLDIKLALIKAFSQQNKKTAAYDLLLKMQKQGIGYDIRADKDLDNIGGTEVYDYLADLFNSALQPFGSAETAFTIPYKGLISKGIAYDPKNEAFFVGTVRTGEIFRFGKDKNIKPFIQANEKNGMWAVLGLAIDSERRHLWVASAVVPQFLGFVPKANGISGIFKYDLDNGQLLKRYMAPHDKLPHLFADLTLTKQGDVYITDSIAPLVFKIPATTDTMEQFFHGQNFINFRGVSFSEKHEYLYVADYALGIIVVDTKGKQARIAEKSPHLNLTGIDSMTYDDASESLIVVQSGFSPQRIMRLDLADNGGVIKNAQPIVGNHSEFADPALGTLVDDMFYFVANSQWGLFQNSNQATDPTQEQETHILRSPIHPSDTNEHQ